MKSALLITDSERVQRLFRELEAKGAVQLRVAAAVAQADREIALSPPDVTFVQSRLSGLSSDITLRHLKKALPKRARIVLLAGDAEDAAQAAQGTLPFVDLTLADEQVEQALAAVLSGAAPSGRKAKGKGEAGAPAPPEPEGEQVPAEPSVAELPPAEQAPVRPHPGQGGEQEEPGAGGGGKAEPGAPATAVPWQAPSLEQPKAPAEARQEKAGTQAPPETAGGAGEGEARPDGAGQGAAARQVARSFEEMMRVAAAKPAAASRPEEVEDRVLLGAGPTEVQAAPEREEPGAPPREEPDLAASEGFRRAEPLAEALRRAEKKKGLPGWVIPAAVALVLIPLAGYLAGRKAAPPETVPAQQIISRGGEAVPQPYLYATSGQGAQGATSARAPQAASPGAKPGAPPQQAANPSEAKPAPAAAPPAQQPAQPAARPAKPAPPGAKAGLATFPPILEGLRVDEGYGKSHPGWKRYVGKRAEYNLFREGELYRAIQVIALGGEPIPEQIFTRVLREFGGGEGYRVESTGTKGDYLLEHGAVKENVGLTIYRAKSDRNIKGFVVYYR